MSWNLWPHKFHGFALAILFEEIFVQHIFSIVSIIKGVLDYDVTQFTLIYR